MNPDRKERLRARYARMAARKQRREDNERDFAVDRKARKERKRRARFAARDRQHPTDTAGDGFKASGNVPRSQVRAAARSDSAAEAPVDCAVIRSVHRTLWSVLLGSEEVTMARPAAALDAAVGDEVDVQRVAGTLRFVARRPRRTWIARSDARRPGREQVLVANVDVGVVTVPADRPRPGLVDRLVAALHGGGVSPLVVLTKCDLLPRLEHRVAESIAALATARPDLLRVSAHSGAGLDALREHLRGRTVAFVGHSGAGKSSLANALDPAGARATGATRAGDGRGRHVTARRELVLLDDGTRLIDTPGIRAFGLAEAAASELATTFPDVAALAARCRFRDCRHEREPGCAVREAVGSGALPATRLAAWRRLREAR